jgi:hypothetical protein
MIGEDSIVQILDIENATPYEDTVSSIFNKFIEKGTQSTNVIYYKPKAGSLKIRDLQGWTDILQLSMFYNADGYTMAKISTELTKPLLVTRDQFIPVYDDESTVGFHGEVKHHFRKCSARVFYDGIIENLRTNDNQFITSDIVNAISIKNAGYVYGIDTKSGFFNANNLHLLSEISYFEKMYK